MERTIAHAPVTMCSYELMRCDTELEDNYERAFKMRRMHTESRKKKTKCEQRQRLTLCRNRERNVSVI